MSKFQTKPILADAVRFDGFEWVDDVREMMFDQSFVQPDWLSDATSEHEGKPGSVYPSGFEPAQLFVETPLGTRRCEVGSWIVRDASGDLHVFTQAEFSAAYEPAGD